MTLNKEIRYSTRYDNPDFYDKHGKLRYGLYEGWSEKAQAVIIFKVEQAYWYGSHESYSGLYDTECIISTEPKLTQHQLWNPHNHILPITNCKLLRVPDDTR